MLNKREQYNYRNQAQPLLLVPVLVMHYLGRIPTFEEYLQLLLVLVLVKLLGAAFISKVVTIVLALLRLLVHVLLCILSILKSSRRLFPLFFRRRVETKRVTLSPFYGPTPLLSSKDLDRYILHKMPALSSTSMETGVPSALPGVTLPDLE